MFEIANIGNMGASLWETITQSLQTMVFLSITLVSFIVLAISFFAGAVMGSDHDIPHDHDAGGHDIHSGDADSDGQYGAAISIFSPKIFFVFLLGFGATGAIASLSDYGALASSLWGLLSGVVFGAIAFGGLSLLYKQQANSVINTGAAVGKVAIVTTTISQGGVGEVEVSVSGNSRTYTAKAKGGTKIIRGWRVKVIENMGGTLLVEVVA